MFVVIIGLIPYSDFYFSSRQQRKKNKMAPYTNRNRSAMSSQMFRAGTKICAGGRFGLFDSRNRHDLMI